MRDPNGVAWTGESLRAETVRVLFEEEEEEERWRREIRGELALGGTEEQARAAYEDRRADFAREPHADEPFEMGDVYSLRVVREIVGVRIVVVMEGNRVAGNVREGLRTITWPRPLDAVAQGPCIGLSLSGLHYQLLFDRGEIENGAVHSESPSSTSKIQQ